MEARILSSRELNRDSSTALPGDDECGECGGHGCPTCTCTDEKCPGPSKDAVEVECESCDDMGCVECCFPDELRTGDK